MPLYEYQCSRCGKSFEIIQKFSDLPLTVHEGCGGPVERLISAPAIQFKGTGWYVTDYKKSGSSGKSTKNGNSGTKASSSAESKSDSSPAPSPAK
jgi:putative FmdB family regulatory protein